MNDDYEFSIEFFVDKHDGLFEFDDECIVGDTPYISDDIDFRYSGIQDDIQEEMNRLELKDGTYHGYVRGTISYESSVSWEYGTTEVDSYPSVERYNFYPYSQEETHE